MPHLTVSLRARPVRRYPGANARRLGQETQRVGQSARRHHRHRGPDPLVRADAEGANQPATATGLRACLRGGAHRVGYCCGRSAATHPRSSDRYGHMWEHAQVGSAPLTLEIRCKALLFDLDGVLVDSRSVVERTWRRWAERHQVDPMPFLQIAHGRRARDTLRMVVPSLATDAEVAGLDATELADREGLRAVPRAKELVTALPRDRWAIVTSCGRDLARLRLGSAGLPVPDTLIVAEAVKPGKPAPDGYLLGASRLGVDPSECVVFEDAPAGIAAGKAAGARVIGLTTTHATGGLPGVDATIADFRGIDIRPEHDAFVVTIPRLQ